MVSSYVVILHNCNPLDSHYDQQQNQSSERNSDLKPSLFNLSTPSQMKINNVFLHNESLSIISFTRPLWLFDLIMEKSTLNSLLDKFLKNGASLFSSRTALTFSRDESMVTDFFSGYGEILESQVIRDSKGQSKGCAFVKFASMTKAEEAKKNIETRSISLPGV